MVNESKIVRLKGFFFNGNLLKKGMVYNLKIAYIEKSVEKRFISQTQYDTREFSIIASELVIKIYKKRGNWG